MKQKVNNTVVALIALLPWVKMDLWDALSFLGIDLRDGQIKKNTISWTRWKNEPLRLKTDKKGRIFAAYGRSATVSLRIKLHMQTTASRSNVIQINVRKATGKRGGWLINTHVVTPVLSRNGKFQFLGKWENYWASEQMLDAGLVSKVVRGKLSEAMLMHKHKGLDINIWGYNTLCEMIFEARALIKQELGELEEKDFSAEDALVVEPY